MRSIVILGSALLLFAASAPVRAGCPSAGEGCDMATQIGVKLEPRLSCLVLDIDANDCTCTAAVTAYNDCAADVMAADFEFTRCEDLASWDTMRFDCLVLSPGWRGEIDLPLQPGAPHGYYEDTLHLLIAGDEYALDLRYEVARVSLGGVCGCGAAASPDPPVGALLLIGLVAVRAAARRRTA